MARPQLQSPSHVGRAFLTLPVCAARHSPLPFSDCFVSAESSSVAHVIPDCTPPLFPTTPGRSRTPPFQRCLRPQHSFLLCILINYQRFINIYGSLLVLWASRVFGDRCRLGTTTPTYECIGMSLTQRRHVETVKLAFRLLWILNFYTYLSASHVPNLSSVVARSNIYISL